jgi:hypothetical protein
MNSTIQVVFHASGGGLSPEYFGAPLVETLYYAP